MDPFDMTVNKAYTVKKGKESQLYQAMIDTYKTGNIEAKEQQGGEICKHDKEVEERESDNQEVVVEDGMIVRVSDVRVKGKCKKCGEKSETRQVKGDQIIGCGLREAKGDEKIVACKSGCKECEGRIRKDIKCIRCKEEIAEIVTKRIQDKPKSGIRAHFMIELINDD